MVSKFENGAQPISKIINQSIKQKVNYLQELDQAVKAHEDQKVYALLDQKRYAAEILHREEKANDTGVMTLVDDITNHLSNYLSSKLINYLSQAYPFFYYEEYQLGHFRIYFGNWWDRRQFGELDVLNIRFIFDQTEYKKLAQSFELSQSGKRFNGEKIDQLSKENDRLQNLIDSQAKREAKKEELQAELKEASARNGLFESSKNREAREAIVSELSKLEDQEEEARTAAGKIKENNQAVLELSKENTILSYERKSIVDTFESFEDFEVQNHNLYANYLKSLVDGGKQVIAHD
ncbi:exonuclease SbcC [Lactobacillus sp. 3B(2020)]|uniref:exonuclease SbcC n=1 Tax=Lactobacillus sp. 3B(2020) TaxID=2695882 RepID=UPI0015DF5D27|nr:exonuclease SbcC [Lactobacillus sp. 3B(2020)]QLL69756.1 exonuclease SbcC [Lactobacillus sp. 3B(2020)]